MDEVELKFRLSGEAEHERLRAALRGLGARDEGQEHEENLLFDDRGGELSDAGSVLRLRVLDGGPRAKLTYKGAARYEGAVKSREEIELSVDDAERMRGLLNALGYEVTLTYAKDRETWRLEDAEVVLDSLVFGHFCEIEGPASTIKRLAEELGLREDQVEMSGYAALMAEYEGEKGAGASPRP